MADMNLRKGKIQGRTLERSDIKLGVEVEFPSGMGGLLKYTCTTLTERFAKFKVNPGYKDIGSWLAFVIVEFDVPEFTGDDWEALDIALSKASKASAVLSDTERAILFKADKYGYINALSWTQFSWTEYGIESSKKAVETQATHWQLAALSGH